MDDPSKTQQQYLMSQQQPVQYPDINNVGPGYQPQQQFPNAQPQYQIPVIQGQGPVVSPQMVQVQGIMYAPVINQFQDKHTSCKFYCPNCKNEQISQVEYEYGTHTYIMMAILFHFTLVLTCLPMCIDGCQDAHHYCPYCKQEVGIDRYKICQ